MSDIIQNLINEEGAVIGTIQHAFRFGFPVDAGEEFGLLVAGHGRLFDGRAEKPAAPPLAGRGEGAMVVPGVAGSTDGD